MGIVNDTKAILIKSAHWMVLNPQLNYTLTENTSIFHNVHHCKGDLSIRIALLSHIR